MPKVKQFGKEAVQRFLEMLVKIKLRRGRPVIIGVTGSFGKTSTKEAIYTVLRSGYSVECAKKGLNTEIGLALAVLGRESGFSSPVKWLGILIKAVFNAFFSKKTDFLVLEYGADKPGDIENLTKIAKPDIAVITHIAEVHRAKGQFKSEEEIFNEKKKLAVSLGREGIAILNAKDKFLKNLEGKLNCRTLMWNNKTFFADNLKNTLSGFEAAIHMDGKKFTAHFPIAGAYHIDILLPALLIGALKGITPEEGIAALQNFKLPPGRMSIIEGKFGAIILDGTYNASPRTVEQALELLKDFPGKRKIAVLGNMNEIGDTTRQAHEEIGMLLGKWLDMLITVGENARIIAEKGLKNGLSKHKIKTLSSAEEAGRLLAPQLGKRDIVLLKGSQNLVRLERTVKILMAHPEQAHKLLCRQEPEWHKIQ